MKVKNISQTVITLRCKEGKDKINPLESVEIKKGNEEFANLLIKEGKLQLVKSAATATDK